MTDVNPEPLDPGHVDSSEPDAPDADQLSGAFIKMPVAVLGRADLIATAKLLYATLLDRNDAIARERNLSPEERLVFHQAESGPIMAKLRAWCTRQLEDRLVEPNSGLGQAISYLLRHWGELTLFLRQPGAPLDNNIAERALKRAILHRKNAMFYKTQNGAHVGDVFMSLIHTCELGGANPFDYLTELQRHASELRTNPRQWMPWSYRESITSIRPS